jgi:hypothetical protein
MLEKRYYEALNSIPAPGGGCHPSLLGVANLGVIAGHGPNRLFIEIRNAIPSGRRNVPDREITDTINKALADKRTFTPKARPKPVVKDSKTTLQKIISQSKITDEVDLWESSPIRLSEDPQHDMILFLETLYQRTDLVWTGDRIQPGIMGVTIRTAADWISYFKNGGKTSPFIIINPLTGQSAPTKSGDKETLRGDGNITDFRYCMAEFDNLGREDQIRFWSAVKLPVVALIDSGNKSIHGWLDVKKLCEVGTAEQWDHEIKGRLYDRILKPLGVDGACSNPSRLSRLPGHYRTEKEAIQKLLWLSPEGKTIC